MTTNSSIPEQAANTGGLLTINEFCRTYSCGRTKLYDEVQKGRIQLLKLGSSSRISRYEAERWARSLPVVRAVS